MNDTNWVGAIAEAAVIHALTAKQFHIFNQVTGKAPFDLVACKDGRLWRVSVKGTACNPGTRGSYEIGIRSTRHNTKSFRCYPFDSSQCDVLAVYIHHTKAVCFLKSTLIKAKQSLSFRERPTRYARQMLLISDYLEPNFD